GPWPSSCQKIAPGAAHGPPGTSIRSRKAMRTWIGAGWVLAVTLIAAPAEAQLGGRVTLEPFVGYGFFGGLPESNAELEADLTYGGRGAYSLASQWAVFGTFQRSTPTLAPGGELNVDHWSAGVEFSYIPRGGAEGM